MHQAHPELRCSFCNKTQRSVRKLVAGPEVYICDECVDICVDVIAEDRTDAPPAYSGHLANAPFHVLPQCSLCRMATPLEHLLAVHSRGALCPGCIGAIEAAVAVAKGEGGQ